MVGAFEPFCLDEDDEPDLPEGIKKQNRIIGYIVTFLAVFTLGTTEIFASWYSGILGGTSFESGLAMGAFGFVFIFSSIIGGRVSDRVGRKRTLMIATAVYAGVIMLYLIPSIIPLHLILIRILEGITYGFIAPTIEGMVAELEPEAQCATLGNFSTSWSASMILPPIVIAYLSGVYGNLSSIYVIIAVEILSFLIIIGFLKGYRRKRSSDQNEEFQSVQYSSVKSSDSKTSPRFLASYLSVMLWGIISTVVLALFPTYIETLIDQGYPFVREDFGNLLLLWNTARTIAFIVISQLPEQYMKEVVILGIILSAISSLMIYLFLDIWILAIAMSLSGIAVGLCYLGALFFVVSATESEKGEHAGLVESMGGIGLTVGPIIGGWVMGFNLVFPFLMCTIISFIILILTGWLFSKSDL
jgi:MFS family permease